MKETTFQKRISKEHTENTSGQEIQMKCPTLSKYIGEMPHLTVNQSCIQGLQLL